MSGVLEQQVLRVAVQVVTDLRETERKQQREYHHHRNDGVQDHFSANRQRHVAVLARFSKRLSSPRCRRDHAGQKKPPACRGSVSACAEFAVVVTRRTSRLNDSDRRVRSGVMTALAFLALAKTNELGQRED